MICPHCQKTIENDALFCSECGMSVAGEPRQAAHDRKRPYWFALLLIPAVLIAAGVGYYKYFLPSGVAAEVNGEEITLAELDAAVSRRTPVEGRFSDGMRLQALNELIAERILLQEARKAGISVSREEAKAEASAARAASRLDDAAFTKVVDARYGSVRFFEEELGRRLLIKKLLVAKAGPGGADPAAAAHELDRWYQGVSQAASVRVALASQGGSGCGGGCNRAEGGGSPCGKGRDAMRAGDVSAPSASPKAAKAAEAGLEYWKTKYGPDQVAAKVRDFGCHMQIDIVKDETVIGSLRYQGGVITE